MTLHSYRDYVLTIEPVPDDEAYYGVEIPDLPDVVTSGSTLPEAFTHACEAIDLYLEALDRLGRPHPEPRHRLVMESA